MVKEDGVVIKVLYNGEKLKLKNTQKLQFTSLSAFADKLAYTWESWAGNYQRVRNTGMTTVSLDTMQKWHNTDFLALVRDPYPWYGEEYLNRLVPVLDVYGRGALVAAIDAKLVCTTHLQYLKKQGKMQVTDHQVEFI